MLGFLSSAQFLVTNLVCSGSFLDKQSQADQNRLRVEAAVKPLIAPSLEPIEEQHQFAGLQPVEVGGDEGRREFELFPGRILLQSAAEAQIHQLRNEPGSRFPFPICPVNDGQRGEVSKEAA